MEGFLNTRAGEKSGSMMGLPTRLSIFVSIFFFLVSRRKKIGLDCGIKPMPQVLFILFFFLYEARHESLGCWAAMRFLFSSRG